MPDGQNPHSTAATLPTTPGLAAKPTNFRWVICGLLFYATTVNYVDRSVLGVLAPDLKKIIGWTDTQYGYIGTAFSAAYGLGFIFMGRLIDAIGTRFGYALALFFWTAAAASTAFARTTFQFGIARFFLALGEAGNFPAAIKTVAEWFPQRQRSTATGIFNAGSNVGAILAPLLVPMVVLQWGWQAAFFITPILAIIWIILWLTLYRSPANHPKINQAERDLIIGDSPAESATGENAQVPTVRWRHILPHRQAWAFMLGKFFTDPIWWFYLFWAGKFFADTFHVSITSGLAAPLIVIYVLADFGSIGGGWLSSNLIKKGWTPNGARKTAMFICALCILPVIFAPITSNMWVAAFLIGLAAAAHQGFSANIFTITSDMFPKRAVASVVGLGGLYGAAGSMLMQTYSGIIHDKTKSYLIMFIIAGSVYLLAFVLIQLYAPRLKPIDTTDPDIFPIPLRALACASVGVIAGLIAWLIFLLVTSLHQFDLSADSGTTILHVLVGVCFVIGFISMWLGTRRRLDHGASQSF